MAEESKPAFTAAEIAAQILLFDNALIHTFEKTISAAAEGLAASRVLRAELEQALAGGEELVALRAENERLRQELAALRAPVEETVAEDEAAAAESEPVAETETEPSEEEAAVEVSAAADEDEPATGAAPLEEAALPVNPTW